MGPFSFNAFRFLLGGLFLLPLVALRKKNKQIKPKASSPALLKGGLIAGSLLFLGASFQQTGIQYTTIGNTGFITGLYIIFVPVISLFLGVRYHHKIWFAVALACAGLYLLSGMNGLHISDGDFLVLLGAIFWALHVIIVDHMSSRHDQIKFAALQFFTCAILSYLAAISTGDKMILLTFEEWKWVIVSGFLAIGIGYTLQVIGQTTSPAAQSAVILSLEAVFAALAGYVFYHEILGFRGYLGCGLMFIGCLLTQRYPPINLNER